MASENPSDSVEAEATSESAVQALDPKPVEPAAVSTEEHAASNASGESGEDPAFDPPREAKDPGRRHRFESMLPLIRRGIEKSIEAGLNTFEKSVETGRETSGAVREAFQEVRIPRDMASAVGKALSEAKLPREIASAVFGQLDETKNDVLRIVAREVRDFLEATDIATELKKALTSLSFEVRTEVRFIPNEAGDGVKPEVRARSRIKRDRPAARDRSHRRGKLRTKPVEPDVDADNEADDDEDE